MFCTFDAEVEVCISEVLSMLKIEPGTPVWSYSAARTAALLAALREDAEITAGYVEIDRAIKTGRDDIDGAEKMIVCVCSCSHSIPRDAEAIGRRSMLDSYIVDGMIDAALFNTSRKMDEMIRQELAVRGLFLTDAIFPGERGADIDLLGSLLDAIKRHTEIDLSLTDGMMLCPEKTLLYAFGVRSEDMERCADRRCAACGMVSCEFRSAL